jgi:hypothetical protein
MYDPLVVDTFLKIYPTLRSSLGDLALIDEATASLTQATAPLVQGPPIDSLTHS